MKEFGKLSFSQLNQAQFIEEIYSQYLEHPETVDPSWKRFFEGMEFAHLYPQEGAPSINCQDLKIFQLLEAYRTLGHYHADIYPMSFYKRPEIKALDIKSYQFEDLDSKVNTLGVLETNEATILEVYNQIKKNYADKIGFEFKHIKNFELVEYLQQRIEKGLSKELKAEEKKSILELLNRAEFLESFLHTKFVGQKRFSIEGLETLIPILRAIVDHGSERGMEEVIVSMSHRGRLNVLANVFEKPYSLLFHEFGENYEPSQEEGSGDVKYHKSYSADIQSSLGKRIHISIPPNSSHLESANTIALGQVRAKQTHKKDDERSRILPILIHGDASIAGQGIIYEGTQFYSLEGYETGGCVHIIMDNQIGFTTLPKEDRSTVYPSDIAKTFDAPVFHVNAEDPEGCIVATHLAVEVRQKFKCDVFIHLNGYRKYGHNEGDEPSYTQPLEYQEIRKKKSIRTLYQESLVEKNILSLDQAKDMENQFKTHLQKSLESSLNYKETPPKEHELFGNRWEYWKQTKLKKTEDLFTPIETAVDEATLKEIATGMTQIPSEFTPHKKIAQLLGMRRAAVLEPQKEPIMDWGLVENLMYGSLLIENYPVRLSGQDSKRGTFSHRHAVIVDQKTAEEYVPLNHLKEDQAPFTVYNSPLSEYGCLAYEYGYSISTSKGLVIWEAQFGDFANGAQITIDCYIAGGEEKWNRLSNLVMLLPHGYEGQGPEHSSARVERYLQLAAQNNMIIVNPSTPAQFFHLMRKHALSYYRKPLIVFTPKKLLRYPKCVASLEDLTQGRFYEILQDPEFKKEREKLVFCTGKIYYELLEEREKRKDEKIGLIRIEQLYPFHHNLLDEILKSYTNFKSCVWVQEEPQNMGAWTELQPIIQKHLPSGMKLEYCGKERMASTAEGTSKRYKAGQQKIINALFGEGQHES